jgi:hypothetical protein
MREDDAVACDCKVGRSARSYGLDSLPETVGELRASEGTSLRDLAEEVNVRLVAAVLDDVDADVAGDPASVYAALADDDVDAERRLRVRNRLTDLDVDPAALEADFVSYQAVRHHLRNCLDVDTSREGITTTAEARGVIESARSRDREVLEQTLRRLQRVGALEDTDISVRVSPRVSCQDCGSSYGVEEFLDSGGCDCST